MNTPRNALRRLKGTVTGALEALCASSRLLTRIHYFLIDRSFDDEMAATLRGKVAFRCNDANLARLRRNTHRLEKGLIMRSRRGVFALDYIGEAVRDFRAIAQRWAGAGPDAPCGPDLEWAGSVLARYFRESDRHPVIDEARTHFEGTTEERAAEDGRSPRPRGELGAPAVSYENLLALALRRRSVRWFEPKPVPLELVDRALLVARQGPSACNRQPYRFVVLRERAGIDAVVNLPGGAAGFGQQIPLLLVAVGDLGCYAEERDRHLIYVDTAFATMGLLLALETVGLSSCVINWPDLRPQNRTATRELGLRDHERIVFLVGVGYADPAGLVPWSEKRSLPQIRSLR